MSIKCMTRVWDFSQQNGTSLLILLALADWADDWGYCYPGHATIARKARTTERNTYLVFRKLEESGEIRIIRRGKGGKRQQETSVYQVIIGMTETEIAKSQVLSNIAKEIFTPEEISSEKFSPENLSNALNVLINRQLSTADTFHVNDQQQLNNGSTEEISPEKISGEKSFTENQCENEFLPPEVLESLKRIGWRGSLADVEQAWREDPERVRQWVWYAGKQGWSGALLRTALRSRGEYPPEIDPNSKLHSRRYVEGAYADFIEH